MANKYQFKTRKHQRGDFLVGLLIAIIIVAVMGSAYWLDMRDSNRAQTIKDTIKKVNLTANQLRANFGINGQYSDVTTAVAVQSRSIPEDQRIRGTNTAQNPFGGEITVAPVTLTSANDAVSLTYANVAPWACAETVIGTQNAGRMISVGGAVVKAIDGALGAAALTAACDVAAPVVIVWHVGRTGA